MADWYAFTIAGAFGLAAGFAAGLLAGWIAFSPVILKEDHRPEEWWV